MSDDRSVAEKTIVTAVRGPSIYLPAPFTQTSNLGGMQATIRGLNQIARELSGEYKIAVFNCQPNGLVSASGYIPVLMSGAPVISGNVVNLQVFANQSGGASSTSAPVVLSEVGSGVNLSSLVVTIVAQGW